MYMFNEVLNMNKKTDQADIALVNFHAGVEVTCPVILGTGMYVWELQD